MILLTTSVCNNFTMLIVVIMHLYLRKTVLFRSYPTTCNIASHGNSSYLLEAESIFRCNKVNSSNYL